MTVAFGWACYLLGVAIFAFGGEHFYGYALIGWAIAIWILEPILERWGR